MSALNEIDQLALRLKAEREARELRRERLQVLSGALEFPMYDNSDLFSLDRWIARNLEALNNYFHQLAASNNEPSLNLDEIGELTIIQYERQLERRAREVALQPRDPKWDEEQQTRRTWQALMADEVCVPEFGEI